MNPNNEQQDGQWEAPQPTPIQQSNPTPEQQVQPAPVVEDFTPTPQSQVQQAQPEMPVETPRQEEGMAQAPSGTVPVQSMTQPVVQNPTPQPAKKKLFIIIAAVAGGLLLVGGAVLTYFMLMVVTPSDYTRANESIRTVNSTYSTIRINASDAKIKTEDERQKRIEEIKAKYADFNSTLDALATEKAIKRDEKAAELYRAVDEKRTKLNTIYTAYIETVQYIAPNLASSENLESSIAALKESVAQIKDTDNKAYIEKIIPLLERYQTMLAKSDAAKKSGKYDNTLFKEATELSAEMTTASKAWQKAQEQKTQDANMTDQLKALTEYLAQKV